MTRHNTNQGSWIDDSGLVGDSTVTMNLESRSGQTLARFARPLKWLVVVALFFGLASLVVGLIGGLGEKSSLSITLAAILASLPIGMIATIWLALYFTRKKLSKIGIRSDKLSTVTSLSDTGIVFVDEKSLYKNQPSVDQLIIGQTSYSVDNHQIIDSKSQQLTGQALENIDIFLAAANFVDAVPSDLIANHYADDYSEIKRLDADFRRHTISLRHWANSKQPYAFVGGQAEDVLSSCDDIWDHGHSRKLAATAKKNLLNSIAQLEDQGKQVAALAYRRLGAKENPKNQKIADYEKGLTWLGIVVSTIEIDQNAVLAVHAARHAGLKLAIFSDDAAKTAGAVAVQAGLAKSTSDLDIITDRDIENTSHKKLLELILRGRLVLASINPSNQLLISELARASDQFTAGCGASASSSAMLKNLDVSLAPRSSKIAYNSFTKLLLAIHHSRVASDTIAQTSRIGGAANVAMLVIVLAGLVVAITADIPAVITSGQIVIIILATQILPLATLAWDKSGGLQTHHPRNNLFNKTPIMDPIWAGLLAAILVLVTYFWYYFSNNVDPANLLASSQIHWQAMTVVYLSLVLCLLANIFQQRATELFSRRQLQNWRFWLAISISILIVMITIYSSWFAAYFQLGSLSLTDWLYVLIVIGIFMLIRQFERHTRRHSHHQLIAKHGRAKIRKHLNSRGIKARA